MITNFLLEISIYLLTSYLKYKEFQLPRELLKNCLLYKLSNEILEGSFIYNI